METFNDTTYEDWLEDIHDIGDYPDGFDPELYDL